MDIFNNNGPAKFAEIINFFDESGPDNFAKVIDNLKGKRVSNSVQDINKNGHNDSEKIFDELGNENNVINKLNNKSENNIAKF